MSNQRTFLAIHCAGYAIVATLTMLTAGCLNWSGDVARYRQVLDGTRPASRPVYDEAGDLTLVRALQLADADNEAIASRGEDYIQALAEKMTQAGNFLPTLTLGPSYSASGVQGSGNQYQTSVPLNLSATGSLSKVSTLRAAEQTADQRAQLLLDERETILLQVVQSYYSALKSERQVQVYESSLKLQTEKVRDEEARLKLGNARPLDLAQSQANLAGTRASWIQSRTDAANARSALARLISVNAVRGALIDAYSPPRDLPEIDQWQQRATASRQDLLAAARSLDAARSSLDAAIREYLPSVTVNFEYFLSNQASGGQSFTGGLSVTGTPQSWTGAVSANIPVFSALSIEADIRRAWSVYRQAGLAESQTRRQVMDDVRESFQNFESSREKIAELSVQVAAAQRAFDLAERAYQLGSMSNLDRLTQLDNLLTTQLNLIAEQFNEKSYYLSLLRSTGGLAQVLGSVY